MDKQTVEIVMELKASGDMADLYTDGINEVWIPHSQIIEKNQLDKKNFELHITEWIAMKKGII